MRSTYKRPPAAAWTITVLVAVNTAWAAAPAPAAAPAATPMQASGKVHAVDVVNQVIKMEGGEYYLVPSSINLTEIKEGDQITLSGEKDANGRLQVKTVAKK